MASESKDDAASGSAGSSVGSTTRSLDDYNDYVDPGSSFQWAVMQFLSPEKILARKDLWMFAHFMRTYVIETRLRCWETFLAFLSKKYALNVTEVLKEFAGFKEHRTTKVAVEYSTIEEDWKTFLFNNEKRLQEEFTAEAGFQTNVRGYKIRPVAAPTAEAAAAAARAHLGGEGDIFETHIVPVGRWCPWDPSDHMLPDDAKIIHQNEELQNLMEAQAEARRQAHAAFLADKERRATAAREEARRGNAMATALGGGR